MAITKLSTSNADSNVEFYARVKAKLKGDETVRMRWTEAELRTEIENIFSEKEIK